MSWKSSHLAARRAAESQRRGQVRFWYHGVGVENLEPVQSEKMHENEISAMVVDVSVKIHKALGPGLLESVYQRILAYELRKAGLEVVREVAVPVYWDGHVIGESFRADMIVNGKVLLELKSIEQTLAVHRKQTLTYIKIADLRLGLLINFGAKLLKDDLHRLVNGLSETT